MSAYNIALFFHVSGAIAYFLASSIWLLGLSIQRRAQRVEQVRAIGSIVDLAGPISGVGLLILIVSGLYMAATVWGFGTGWIDVAIISLILIAPLGAALTVPRRLKIDRLARETPDGPVPANLQRLIHDPILQTSVQTLLILLLGIVFLMTTKPTLAGSIIVMLVALALGVVSSLLLIVRPRRQQVVAPADHA